MRARGLSVRACVTWGGGVCARARARSLCSLCDTLVRAGYGRLNESLEDGPFTAAPFKEASAQISSHTAHWAHREA